MIDVSKFVEVFIPLFIIINPMGIIPNFIEITQQMDRSSSSAVSTRATLSAFFILVLFVFVGKPFLNLIGVTISAFMISCGLLLLYISLGMLSGNPPATRGVETDSHSIVPMSIPLLAGPGAIATTIVLEDAYGKLLVFLSLVAIMGISKMMLDFHKPIVACLGRNGLNAWIRISAMFSAAIAVGLIGKGIILFWW
ncbi:MAG: MarC family protein [Candidatus Methanofastidiosia archaeon]